MEIVNTRNSLKEVFVGIKKLAAQEYGIKHAVKGWHKTFTRNTEGYSDFISNLP